MQYQPQPPPYQPYPPYQPQPYRQVPPPRRRMGAGKIIAIIAGSVVGVIIVLGAIGAALAPPQHKNHPSANNPQPAAAHTRTTSPEAPAPAKSKAKVLATFRGTGDENTPRFTVSGSWKLKWSYNCASFGVAGNFIVLEDRSFSSGVQINEEGKAGHGASWSYSDSGRHYLSVNSECDWTLKVVGTK